MGTLSVEASQVFSSYERQIIASVLVLEAADQGEDGMRAVLHVINNRAGNNPARAIGQVARKKAFSCLNAITKQTNPDYGPALRRAMRDRMWPVAMQMVLDYEAGQLGADITGGATHYCIHPPASWKASFTHVADIGAHRFFRR
jgi:spore germination cell wall hydrolase CwlJ-like protein